MVLFLCYSVQIVLVVVFFAAVVCSFRGVQTREIPVFLLSVSKQFL